MNAVDPFLNGGVSATVMYLLCRIVAGIPYIKVRGRKTPHSPVAFAWLWLWGMAISIPLSKGQHAPGALFLYLVFGVTPAFLLIRHKLKKGAETSEGNGASTRANDPILVTPEPQPAPSRSPTADKNASVPMLQAWIENDAVHCSINPDFWKGDPCTSEVQGWGQLLADTVNQVAIALAQGSDKPADLVRKHLVHHLLGALEVGARRTQ